MQRLLRPCAGILLSAAVLLPALDDPDPMVPDVTWHPFEYDPERSEELQWRTDPRPWHDESEDPVEEDLSSDAGWLEDGRASTRRDEAWEREWSSWESPRPGRVWTGRREPVITWRRDEAGVWRRESDDEDGGDAGSTGDPAGR